MERIPGNGIVKANPENMTIGAKKIAHFILNRGELGRGGWSKFWMSISEFDCRLESDWLDRHDFLREMRN